MQRKERKRKESANAVHQERIDNNRAVVDLLCKKLERDDMVPEGIDVNSLKSEYKLKEDLVERCTLDMFGELVNSQLESFIMARQDLANPEFKSKSKLPGKGNLAEAKEDVKNRIRVGWEYRIKPNSIEGNLPHDIFNIEEEDEDGIHGMRKTVMILGYGDEVNPSDLLSNESWVELAIELHNLDKFDVSSQVTEERKSMADLLASLSIAYILFRAFPG